jgi:thiamine kinase-like enzyme
MPKGSTTIEKVIKQIDDWRGAEVAYGRWPDYFMWNFNYEVTVSRDSQTDKYFVRIPGEKSELFFDRDHVYVGAKLAADVGVGPEVPYYLGDSGTQVTRWLEGYKGLKTDRWIFQHRFEGDFLFKSLDALKKYHNSGQELPNTDTIFDTLHKLAALIYEHDTFRPREMPYLTNLVDRIQEAVEANGGMALKPCVNNINERWTWDFLWNADQEDMKIVDYEWASMNDVCSDLATMSTSAMLYDDHDEELVEYYFGELDPFQFARFKLFKLLVCLKGCYLMAVLDTFRPATFDYIRSYGWKMARLRCLLRDPRVENWIWMLRNHEIYDEWKGYPVG